MIKLIYILLVIMMVRTTTYIDCGGGPPPPPPTQGGGFNTQFLIFDGRIIDYYAYAKGIGKWKREDASDIPQGSIFELPNALMPNGWSADGVGQV